MGTQLENKSKQIKKLTLLFLKLIGELERTKCIYSARQMAPSMEYRQLTYSVEAR